MKADTVQITDLFKGTSVMGIPFFQRSYVWTEENWKKFFDEIVALMGTDDHYFLGAIILKSEGRDKNNFERYTIVDGQQRLTTLVVFSKLLYSMANMDDAFRIRFYLEDSDQPTLVPSRKDTAAYNELLSLEGAFPMKSRDNLALAYEYFRSRMDNEEFRSSARNLIRTMNTQVNFVRIIVERDDKEQQIFDTINSAGVDLTTGELLKNYLFDPENADQYDTMWAPVFENEYWTKNLTNGKNSDKYIESFLYQYMLIKIQEPSFCIQSKEKRKYRKKQNLFENYKKLINGMTINRNDFLNDMIEYASIYRKSVDTSVLSEVLVKVPAHKRLMTLMFAQDFWTPVPYILYILKNVPPCSDRERLFRYLECYLMRRIVCRTNNSNYSDLFSLQLIGQGITTYQGLRDYLNDNEQRAGDLRMPTDEEIAEAVATKEFSKEEAKLILYFLEAKYNPTFRDDENNNEFNNLFAEPLVPYKPSAVWPKPEDMDSDTYRQHTHSLGNYTLIRGGKSSSKTLSQTWKDKARILVKNAENLHMSRALGMNEWNLDSVLTRNRYLSDMINQLWTV